MSLRLTTKILNDVVSVIAAVTHSHYRLSLIVGCDYEHSVKTTHIPTSSSHHLVVSGIMSQATMPDLQRVNSIWFDDGNLIVIAEPKVFRLYKYLLARRSPIFKDMLSIPQPDASIANDAADQRVVDALGFDTSGCALVRLMDKPQDVEWFLSAFFHDR
jgi:hypothetical protein